MLGKNVVGEELKRRASLRPRIAEASHEFTKAGRNTEGPMI
jgi:hypothetical protein